MKTQINALFPSKVQIPTSEQLKAQRENYVLMNQIEFDSALSSAIDKMWDNNLKGSKSMRLPYSCVGHQKTAPFVAEALQSSGYQVSFDKKEGVYIVRWK